MTANQIAYQANLETQRANRAKEAENYRSNRAQEELTKQRDFAKDPVAYTLYSAANTGQSNSSPVNVVVKPNNNNYRKSLLRGIQSIFEKGSDNNDIGINTTRRVVGRAF